ncbi:MAG: hypothetical protein M3R10_01650 [Verrucomicrobiota bacterium]|nr:hypothetical protein [Verrucomicrobiota bacterium]
MKIFAFAIYTCGMFSYFGMMILQSGVLGGTQLVLRAIPEGARSSPVRYYLGVRERWVGTGSTVLFNLVIWILWIGAGYLLFFWRKPVGTRETGQS